MNTDRRPSHLRQHGTYALDSDAQQRAAPIAARQSEAFADTFADLGDDTVMDAAAWQ